MNSIINHLFMTPKQRLDMVFKQNLNCPMSYVKRLQFSIYTGSNCCKYLDTYHAYDKNDFLRDINKYLKFNQSGKQIRYIIMKLLRQKSDYTLSNKIMYLFGFDPDYQILGGTYEPFVKDCIFVKHPLALASEKYLFTDKYNIFLHKLNHKFVILRKRKLIEEQLK